MTTTMVQQGAKDSAANQRGSMQVTQKEELVSTEFSVKNFLKYKTSKTLIVDVWQLGALFFVLNAGLIIYVCYSVYTASQWATAANIRSSVNM